MPHGEEARPGPPQGSQVPEQALTIARSLSCGDLLSPESLPRAQGSRALGDGCEWLERGGQRERQAQPDTQSRGL